MPSRGPNDSNPQGINHQQIRKTAEYLINNDNMPICRKTGIRIEEELSENNDPPNVRFRDRTADDFPTRGRPARRERCADTTSDESISPPRGHLQSAVVDLHQDRNRFDMSRDEIDIYSDQYNPIEEFNQQARNVTMTSRCSQRMQQRNNQDYHNNEYDFRQNQRSRTSLQYKRHDRQEQRVGHHERQHKRPRSNTPTRGDDRYDDRDDYDNRYSHRERSYYDKPYTRQCTRYRSGESYDSTSTSEERYAKKGKVRSGISAKPTSSVMEQMRYPHFSLGQEPGFIGLNLQFHHLSYEQFIAGEITTIMSTQNTEERRGRLSLLHNISLWKLRAGVQWVQIRNLYAHIIRKLENKEIGWNTDWTKFERNIHDKVNIPTKSDQQKSTGTAKVNTEPNMTWFCRNFQKP